MWHYENETRKQGHEIIAGIDEAGRGPLAGPVVAASVILPENCRVEGLNDSKKLSEKKKEPDFSNYPEKSSCNRHRDNL